MTHQQLTSFLASWKEMSPSVCPTQTSSRSILTSGFLSLLLYQFLTALHWRILNGFFFFLILLLLHLSGQSIGTSFPKERLSLPSSLKWEVSVHTVSLNMKIPPTIRWVHIDVKVDRLINLMSDHSFSRWGLHRQHWSHVHKTKGSVDHHEPRRAQPDCPGQVPQLHVHCQVWAERLSPCWEEDYLGASCVSFFFCCFLLLFAAVHVCCGHSFVVVECVVARW